MNRDDCTLFSGAAQGAEAEFGASAERYGIAEVNYTFDGHSDARQRGLRVLTNAELKRGDVSIAYVSKLMNRRYPETPVFRKVLQTIWYQVNSGQEIYVVGEVHADGTVKGGTGVAAEYAKFFNKPVFVYDQARHGWFRWTGGQWDATPPPTIMHPQFTGTGTRFLQDSGRDAIRTLFARTFG